MICHAATMMTVAQMATWTTAANGASVARKLVINGFNYKIKIVATNSDV